MRTAEPEDETNFENVVQSEIQVYPNPAADNVSVIIPAEWGTGRVSVYNSSGQLVLSTTSNEGNTTTLSLDMLADGLYFINFANASHSSVTKLVKAAK